MYMLKSKFIFKNSEAFLRNVKFSLIQNALTYNGENHNHKVKNVPSYSEVVVSEGDQFQHTFSSEKDNKNHIYPI